MFDMMIAQSIAGRRSRTFDHVINDYLPKGDMRELVGNGIIEYLSASDRDYSQLMIEICNLFAETDSEKEVISLAREWLASKGKEGSEDVFDRFFNKSVKIEEEGKQSSLLLCNLINFNSPDIWFYAKDMGKEKEISALLDEYL